MKKEKIYLEDIPLEEAQAVFHKAFVEAGLAQPLTTETIPLSQANGRVTAQAVWAKLSAPHYHASAHGWVCPTRQRQRRRDRNASHPILPW
ncbi:MAG: hypothetical protein M5U34_27370 [Chloroflexi bacterium]|nr:hypothetical protein [Chloroflexota bacterium]